MKILHLTHTDIRFDNRIIKEIDALSQVPEYELFGIGLVRDEGAANHDVAHLRASIINLKLTFRGVGYLPKFLKHSLIFIEFLIRTLKYSLKIKPDVIHCHDTLVLPIGVFLRLFTKSKIVYDAHELESDKNGQSKIYSYGTLILEKVCIRFTDLLITVSPSIQDWYKSKFNIVNSILILNSPQIKGLNYRKNEDLLGEKYFHDKFNIEYDKLVFIYLGALMPGRGVELLLDAFSSDRINSHIVFMGFGIQKDLILERTKTSRNVHYHEPVKHDEVVNYVNHANVGLCMLQNISLSDYYCLPNKLFEYVFSGIPVLASDFPDIKNLIDLYKLGWYCSFNLEDVIKGIIKIESENILKISDDLFKISWQAQADELIVAYKNLK
jgi:glycosyltransferase involved in cell wall biosynthesis